MYLMGTTEPEGKHSHRGRKTPTYATGWYTQHCTFSGKDRLRLMKIGHNASETFCGDETQIHASFVATTDRL